MSSSRWRYLSSRSNHTDNGKLAKRSAKKSLKITSHGNENTHPRSNTAQNLMDGHQLMNTMKVLSHVTTTALKSLSGSTRATLLRLCQTSEDDLLILFSNKIMSLWNGDKFFNLWVVRITKYSAACPTLRSAPSAKSWCVVDELLRSSVSNDFSLLLASLRVVGTEKLPGRVLVDASPDSLGRLTSMFCTKKGKTNWLLKWARGVCPE